MKKIFITSLICFFVFANVKAQQEIKIEVEVPPVEAPIPANHTEEEFYHQIYLDRPASKLHKLEYDKDQQPIEGELSKDRTRVILKNYKGRERVKVDVTFSDGKQEEFVKSSCYIDPVPPM